MNLNKIPFKEFEHFILRTPLLPFQHFKTVFNDSKVDSDLLKKTFSDPLIQEAIFLASPTLFFEIEKWIDGKLNSKSSEKVKLSFCKYLSRISTRCTPFGIFAGCSLGKFAEHTTLNIENPVDHKRNTRLDMNYLVALTQNLARQNHIKNQLLYHINSSIYSVGQKLRYIEYFYSEGLRQHKIVEIDNSPALQKVLSKASNGVSLKVLAKELHVLGYNTQEIDHFIDEIIESQVLISSLEPSVCGPPILNQIISVLDNLKNCQNEVNFLKELSIRLKNLDKIIGNDVNEYLELNNWLKNMSTTFELKYLIQTDMEVATRACTIDKKIVSDIKKALAFFNRITPSRSENNLNSFKKVFYERYEDREMPLCQVLDLESGIGYLQNTGLGDINPLIDDLVIPEVENTLPVKDLKFSRFHEKLMAKLSEARDNDKKVIKLEEEDLPFLTDSWKDLPDTMFALAELINENNEVKIKISDFGGSSAANLLGRFCHENSPISELVESIVVKEKKLNYNKIIAEIVHLPEARIGNVLMRPNLRDYELPYLSNSLVPNDRQVRIQDLFISIRNNRIFLRSKSLNKEVIPRLTNAHNFSVKAMPIYHFLCDMQTQDKRPVIGVNFRAINEIVDFLPRIELNNLILQEARWRIKMEDLEYSIQSSDDAELFSAISGLRKKKGLPQYVKLRDSDNELLIDLDNITSIRMLLGLVKNLDEFLLIEYLHWKDGIVRSDKGHFSNQIIVPFFNTSSRNKQ